MKLKRVFVSHRWSIESQIFTTGTPRQTVSPYVNDPIQDTEEESTVGEGLLNEKINTETHDKITATLLQYFTNATPVAEEKFAKESSCNSKGESG